jgi:hypothetical protein
MEEPRVADGILHEGMGVYGPDEKRYGVVGRVAETGVYVGEQYLERRLIERAEADRIYLSPAGVQYFAPAGDGTTDGMAVDQPPPGYVATPTEVHAVPPDVHAAPTEVQPVTGDHRPSAGL